MPSQFARKAIWRFTIAAMALAGFYEAGHCWYRYTYPYGAKHACLKGLGLSLLGYAERHNGHFPTGGCCPEASLSLLYREEPDLGACVLSGKTKSTEAAQELLERGELLGPDTCDWHYVEGLTQSDDPRLALVWDKVGLGHDGQRLSGGGHSILRVNCMEEVIPGSEWPQFLEEQEQLMAARTEAAKKGLPALTARVRLPTGEIVDHFDASYSLEYRYEYSSGGGGSYGPYTGFRLESSVLRWRNLPDDATSTFLLSLNGWKSKPVVVQGLQGKAVPDAVIFEMQAVNSEKPPEQPAARPSR